MLNKNEIKELVGKRIIVVAREKLEDISASFVKQHYSGISGYSGYTGICGYSGTSGSIKDDKYVLKLKTVELISFDEYLIQEITEDVDFIKVLNLSYYSNTNGHWYTCENFFDAFNIIRVLPPQEKIL